MRPKDGFSFVDYPQGFGYLTEVRRGGMPLGIVLRNVYDQELAHARYFATDMTEIPAESEPAQVMKNAIACAFRTQTAPGSAAAGPGRPPPPSPGMASPQRAQYRPRQPPQVPGHELHLE
jgi:hypothetical protein